MILKSDVYDFTTFKILSIIKLAESLFEKICLNTGFQITNLTPEEGIG